MERFLEFLSKLGNSPTIDIVVILLTLYFCGLLSSCGVIQKVPQDISAEGAITKEKVVNRTTKWYYNPENYD